MMAVVRLKAGNSTLESELEKQGMGQVSVLVAEDNADIRLLVHTLLEEAGFTVTGVEDGERALEALDRAHPDLILVDLMMPQVDGIELIRRVRARGELAGLPIVIMTAYGGDQIAQAYLSGATVTVRKPLEPDLLIRTIKQALPEGKFRGH